MEEEQQPLQSKEPPGWSEETPPSPQPPKPRVKKKPFQWKSLGGNGIIVVFGLIVLVLLYAFINRIFIDPPVESEISQGGKTHTIQLDVLNGSGTPKLGQRVTDYLRARGFDVVEMGNYKETGVEFTLVMDRAGNLAAARQVAEALGVSKEHVVQKIDKNAFLDVSVVIGKDFKSLKPLK
jgi:hypothetical protein